MSSISVFIQEEFCSYMLLENQLKDVMTSEDREVSNPPSPPFPPPPPPPPPAPPSFLGYT